MKERIYKTPSGEIHYWVNDIRADAVTLVFLPGLTADHRLFDRQIAYFKDRHNVFVWDAPGHAASWPFAFDFTLDDKATWLQEIFGWERIERPVMIGQSMGGYVAQAFAQLYPETICGFVSIDSAPLQRKYITGIELWLLKRMEPVYRYYPWKWLLRSGTNGVAVTDYGRELMQQMMMGYNGDKERYARLSGHGFKILAEAIEKDLPYEIGCPARLICGEKDRAGSCIRYSRAWHEGSGIPLVWIKNAGHNANTDCPEEVNRVISELVAEICYKV